MAKTRAAFDGVTFDADPIAEKVWVRVLKRGDGKISTGVHDNRGGDVLYEKDETFEAPRNVAEELESRDFVEIGNFAPDAEKRGPGRPPKAAE
jgi:beta-phosphoglucomutase-like phosphatase (HAD superfamily)